MGDKTKKKVYYINVVDYNNGDRKRSPIFSSKEKAIEYFEKHIADKGGFNHDKSMEDVETIKKFKDRFIIETTRKSYNKDGSLSNSWSFNAIFDIIEEEVL